jgi:hypothetical protein
MFGINILTGGIPFVFAGAPVTIPFPGCSSCTIGAIDVGLATNSVQLTVPNQPALVGLQLTFQGASLGYTYPCTGGILISRAVDVTIQ